MKITAVTSYPVNVSAKTNWLFLKVDTDEGLSGLGEATLSGGWEDIQRACVARCPGLAYIHNPPAGSRGIRC